jgi:hypothetical protein
MKKLSAVVLLFVVLSCTRISAQGLPITPADSVYTSINVTDAFALASGYIYLHNNRADSIKVTWRMITDSGTTSGWSVQLCDNSNCYNLPGPPRTSLLVAPGDSLDMHSQLAPNCITGSGYLKISAQVVGDTGAAMILTYKVDATSTCSSGINSISGDNIHVYPNPANDMITLSGFEAGQLHNVQIADLQGNAIQAFEANSHESVNLNINSLPAGLYFVKITDAEGKLTAVKKITKL